MRIMKKKLELVKDVFVFIPFWRGLVLYLFLQKGFPYHNPLQEFNVDIV